MNYLNNFYFKMLVKSAKMTNNMNNDKVFKDIISLFQTTVPDLLPHVWLIDKSSPQWEKVFKSLIKKKFIQDTILLVEKKKYIKLSYGDVEKAFNERMVIADIFHRYKIWERDYSIFYYK